MKLLSLVCALWLAQISAGLAGSATLLGVGATSVTAAGYQGPGDTAPGAVAFWSCRAYSSATKGTKAYRVVRSIDSAETDINSVASTGLCDTAPYVGAGFCTGGGVTCTVKTYYDQTGALACGGAACDLVQATVGNQGVISPTALNGWPCAQVFGGGIMATAGSITQALPVTLTNIYDRTGNLAGFSSLMYGTTSGPSIFFSPDPTNNVNIAAGTTVSGTASSNAYHSLTSTVFAANSASSNMVVDGGTIATGAMGTSAFSATTITVWNSGGAPFQGQWCEGGIWPSNSVGAALETNMHSSTNGWNF